MMEDDHRQQDQADLIDMARELLADPFLPGKVMAGREDEIVQLPAVLHLHGGAARHPDPPLRRQPPHRPGDATAWRSRRSCGPRRCSWPGGGVAGLKAARHRRPAGAPGHPVRKDPDALGGILKSEQAVPFKREMYELGLTLERLARPGGRGHPAEHRRHPRVRGARSRRTPSFWPWAPHPIVPPLPGIDGDNVIVVNDYYKNTEKVERYRGGAGRRSCRL